MFKKSSLEKELKKYIGNVFDWHQIEKVLLQYGSNVSINTGYGVHLVQVFIDGYEIVFDLNDGFIYDIYL